MSHRSSLGAAARIAPFIVVSLAAAGPLACGVGTQNTNDTQKPAIHSVQAELGKPNPGTLDLAAGDVRRVISGATPLTLRISVDDDQTATESLTVQALDGSHEPLAKQTPTVHNGLWRIATTAKPGLTVRVAVSDAAGNEAIWPHAALFPTRSEALIGTWTLLVYSDKGDVTSRPHDALTADRWCQDDDAASGGPRGGSWSVLGDGRLKLETRHRMKCDTSDFGSEWNSIESTRIAEFYVDATYFSDRPYTRKSGDSSGGELVGTWTYRAETQRAGADKSVTSTLVLGADKAFEQVTEDGGKLAGSYELRSNSDYANSFGDLLVVTVKTIDGSAVTPKTTVHYYTVRAGLLLVDPFVKLR